MKKSFFQSVNFNSPLNFLTLDQSRRIIELVHSKISYRLIRVGFSNLHQDKTLKDYKVLSLIQIYFATISSKQKLRLQYEIKEEKLNSNSGL